MTWSGKAEVAELDEEEEEELAASCAAFCSHSTADEAEGISADPELARV
jgi:hypothetical protein